MVAPRYRAALAVAAISGCGGGPVHPATPGGELRERIATSSQEGLAFTVELATRDRPAAVEAALRIVTKLVVASHPYLELGDTERVAREIGRATTDWLCGRTVTVTALTIEPTDLPSDLAAKVRSEMAAARSRPPPPELPPGLFTSGCPGSAVGAHD